MFMEFEERMLKCFSKSFKKYYPYKQLRSFGFKRYRCRSCGNFFWSLNPREVCGESKCVKMIGGRRLIRRKLNYFDVWRIYKQFFERYGYVALPRYPVVSRWYPELYFVVAGINLFQPHIVNGEVEPFEYLTIERQFCLRFQDVDLVGLNPKTYSGFIMLGQHAFNTKEKYTYFKEEAISQIHEFLTKVLKLNEEEIIYNESMWYGAGNFGPSVEFLANGVELGNQVYIQYKMVDSRVRELNTKTVDMGAGMERFAWIASDEPTSYDVTFPYVIRKILKELKLDLDRKLFDTFLKYSYAVESGKDVHHLIELVSKNEGINSVKLMEEIERISSIYVLADHSRSILVAVTDGALPSNVGGGYNIRYLVRRCLSILKSLRADFGLKELLNWHRVELGKFFPELRKGRKLFEIIEVERRRFIENEQKCMKVLEKVEKVDEPLLLKLYDSYGINPELVREFLKRKGIEIQVPPDFYKKVQALHQKREIVREREELDVSRFPPTKLLYYEDPELGEFEAEVLGNIGNYIVLDRTAFYPIGGGQVSDIGYIGKAKVNNVIKVGEVVLHAVDGAKFRKHEKVKCQVDIERRKEIMKHHTATHIINRACVLTLGDHIWQHGSYKDEEKAHLDITHYQTLSFEEIQKIERIANEVVRKKLDVRIYWMHRNDAEKRFGFRIYQGGAVPGREIRIVEIENFEVEACGGLHCKNTGEIELIKIINVERIHDGVVRITFKAGKKAIEEMQRQEKIIKELRDLWHVGIDQIPSTAKRFFEEWKHLRKENEKLKEDLLRMLILSEIQKGDICYMDAKFLDTLGTVIKVVNSISDQLIGKVLVIHLREFGYALSRKGNVSALEELSKFYEKVSGNNLEAKGFKRKT